MNSILGGHSHDDHSHSHDYTGNASSVIIALAGDLFHNVTDGIILASTFALSKKLGVVTTIAVFIHELPHEIGDFAYLYKNGYSYISALSYQMLTGFGAMLGAIACIKFSHEVTIEMAAISGGTFIYMAMCFFLQDLRETKSLTSGISATFSMVLGLY